MRLINFVDYESLVTYTQVQRRRCGITRQKSVKIEDPESQIQTLNEKIAPIQPSSNDTKEQLLVDLDSGSRTLIFVIIMKRNLHKMTLIGINNIII